LQSTGGFYNFSNIRYAQPPVGTLRFRAPLPPTGRKTTVDNGSVGRICPQANPAWELIAADFVPDYLEGIPFNASAASAGSSNMTGMLPPQDPRTTEDCLFLDVVVPETIFKGASKNANDTSGAPVLVWIYGGGYTFGEKSAYSAAGLIHAAQLNNTEGIIFVSLNYRLGAFGWLSGPTFQQDGTANAGLYDQRLALQWVQDNIHLFGGDPNRVTVIGESAGGGSIMHQITAFGGLNGPAPFQQAVLQSAAFQNVVSNLQEETIFNTFLGLLKVSTIEEARQLPLTALQTANIIQVANSSYGDFTYGPVVDGLFAPAIPGKLLLQGSYDHNLKLMLGHNADEGLDFTSPFITNDTTFNEYIQTAFPTINPSVATYIETVLYPPQMPGTLALTGYSDETGRAVLAVTESTFT
jgi:carboxylesterase type B